MGKDTSDPQRNVGVTWLEHSHKRKKVTKFTVNLVLSEESKDLHIMIPIFTGFTVSQQVIDSTRGFSHALEPRTP